MTELVQLETPTTLNLIAIFRRADYEAATPVKNVGPRAPVSLRVTSAEDTRRRVDEYNLRIHVTRLKSVGFMNPTAAFSSRKR